MKCWITHSQHMKMYLPGTHRANLSCVMNEKNTFTSISRKSTKDQVSIQHFIITNFDGMIVCDVCACALAMNHNISGISRWISITSLDIEYVFDGNCVLFDEKFCKKSSFVKFSNNMPEMIQIRIRTMKQTNLKPITPNCEIANSLYQSTHSKNFHIQIFSFMECNLFSKVKLIFIKMLGNVKIVKKHKENILQKIELKTE